MERPVYLFTGFMDSGKTSLVNDTIFNSDFTNGHKTLLIVCEEGDEEYDEAQLKKKQVVLEKIEEESDFTEAKLSELCKKHRPDYVFIEYNGTWQMSTFADLKLPEGMVLTQVLTTVEGPTFDMYLTNMRTMMLDQLFLSDVIIINRSTDDLPKAKFRAAIKANNRKAQIVYERPDGSIDENAMNEMPFDKSQDFLELSDTDYALFYMDIMDHPKDYNGKTIKFRALIYKPDDYKKPGFVPGRFAMTCCADDIQFLGLVCKSDHKDQVSHKSWVDITAKVRYEFSRDYGGRGPVLYETGLVAAEQPEDPLVYFS